MAKALNFLRSNLISILLLLLVGGWIGYQRLEAWLAYRQHIGKPAPGFVLNDLSGKARSLLPGPDAKTRTLVVFWATWCGVCRSEIDTLREAQSRFASKKFRLVSVLLPQNETQKEVEDFVKKHKINYPVLIDSGRVSDAYGVRALPTLVWIQEDGSIQDIGVGRSFGLIGKLEDWLREDG